MNAIPELTRWREARGEELGLGRALHFEEAAAMIVVDGAPANKTTWHAWETGRKVPRPAYMRALCELIGQSSDIFYRKAETEQPNPAPAGGIELAA